MACKVVGAFVVLAVMLAGCADDAPAPTKTGEKKDEAWGPSSDTVYLLAPSKTTLAEPNGTTTIETPVYPTNAAIGNPVEWRYEFYNNSETEAFTATFHMRAKDQVMHHGYLTPVGAGTCTWRFQIDHGSARPVDICAASEPGPLDGDFTLEFDGSFPEVEEGDKIVIRLVAFIDGNPDETNLYVLTGSKDAPSGVQFEGLIDPIDPPERSDEKAEA